MKNELKQKLKKTQGKFNRIRIVFLVIGLILTLLMVLLKSIFIFSLIVGLTILFIIKVEFLYLKEIRRLKQLIEEERRM
ncbi:hypothetical protein SN811_00470 [Ligilactobacillus agilis]|uniref:Uncharacterized protein n=1 Tax=Ligilactobacillus agilis TaxID=1601 RepID=A0A6F9Y272_9LACO|nr:hypothetical protein [Ligilactobacillus agilis]GET11547.1 hypothetical protein SN811_00470 [Ligilactobacillus agilis]